MDVATVKTNPVEPAANGKAGGGTAEQLLGDFSAAVAQRMTQGGYAAGKQGKNALVSRLTTQIKTPIDPPKPYRGPEAKPHKSARNTVDDTPPPRYETAPKERAPALADAHDNAPSPHTDTTSDAPRETAHNDDNAPSDQADTNHRGSSSDDQKADTPPADQSAAASAAASTDDTATGDAAVLTAQHVAATLPTAKVGDATKDESAKTTVNPTAPQQESEEGLETALTADSGNKEVEGDDAKAAQPRAPKEAKGKTHAAQAQTGQGTAQKVDAQAGGDKGATIAQQQAADLSKKIGPDQAINVTVNVTKASDELVSQPSANLAGPALAKTESESPTSTASQSSAKSLTPQIDTHGQSGQKGAEGQTPNQQQAQAQTAQAQAAQALVAKATATAVESKATQSIDAGTTSQTTKIGGAEAAPSSQAPASSGAPAQTQQAAAPKQAAAAQQHARAQVTDQVKVQISKAISDGIDSIRIQLKPAHLGRVDVHLEIGKDGRVSAMISADNKDTLDLLKQDSRELERSLRDAGLNVGSGDLSFNLRGQDGQGAQANERTQSNIAPADPILEPTLDELLQTQASRPNIISKDRIDVTA